MRLDREKRKRVEQNTGVKRSWKSLVLFAAVAVCMTAGVMTGCGKQKNPGEIGQQETGRQTKQQTAQQEAERQEQQTQLQVFVAASLDTVMTELIEQYQKRRPDIRIRCNADSSGKLAVQIREGYACDIFFSAAQKQMDELEAEGLVEDGTRVDLVNNQVVLIAGRDSGTKVTGLADLKEAESIALAGGSVPVGRYTRAALAASGVLTERADVADITTEQVSEALGGVEISEQDNVSKVLIAVVEGSCEVGTVYYSDIYGYEDKITVLETVDQSLTGDVIYPAAGIVNPDADAAQKEAAEDFLAYLRSEEAKQIFQKYYFGTDVS